MTEETASNGVQQDSKNLSLLMWIGTIFFGFIPSLIFYFVKSDDKFIVSHSKEALNWSITSFIAYIVASILTIIVIGAFMYPIIWLCNVVFSIMGAVKASNGEEFKVPMTIRLIK